MQSKLTARQTVELFQLVFVRTLYSGLKDKALIAIKGGINLRFFFKSVRFSEDLDLDVVTMARETLENRVDRLLVSPLLLSPLKARGIVITDVTKPKQTATMQKWKLRVANPDATLEERTKIEFSKRADVKTAAFESVDSELAKAYAFPAFPATHYRTRDAVTQKIHALADRTEPQPRDVFDLHLLFSRPDAPTKVDHQAAKWIDAAVTNAAALTYDEYVALVVAYLEPGHVEGYSSKDTWESMQAEVISRIEALR